VVARAFCHDCPARSHRLRETGRKTRGLRPESGKRPAGFVRASDLRDEDFSRYLSELGKHAAE
jgi:hypothetical protein